jgi:hypothetical protein
VADHAARKGDVGNASRILVRKPEAKIDHLGSLGVDRG